MLSVLGVFGKSSNSLGRYALAPAAAAQLVELDVSRTSVPVREDYTK